MEQQRHVLIVLPHPDDETGLSGTVAAYIREGTPVTYVCLTLGEMGRNMGVPPIANRMTLPQVRRRELEQACRVIGIEDVRMWGLHDKTVEFENRETLMRRIEAVIRETEASLVLTFYPGYSVHPDHDACGSAVVGAVAAMPAAERPAVYAVAFSPGCEDVLGPPTVVNDVSGQLDMKLEALRAHESQFRHMAGMLALDDEQVRARWGKERFWEYRFDAEKG